MKLIHLLAACLVTSVAFSQQDSVFTKRWMPIVGKVEKQEKRTIYVQRENTRVGILYPIKKSVITHIRYADGRIEYFNPKTEKTDLPRKSVEKMEAKEEEPTTVQKEPAEIQSEVPKISDSKKSVNKSDSVLNYFDGWKRKEPFQFKVSEVKVIALAPTIGLGVQFPLYENRLYLGVDMNTSLNINHYRRRGLESNTIPNNQYRKIDVNNQYVTDAFSYLAKYEGNYHSTNTSFNLNAKAFVLPVDWRLQGFIGAGVGVASINYLSIQYLYLRDESDPNILRFSGNQVELEQTTAFNYNLTFGLQFRCNDSWSVGMALIANQNSYKAQTNELVYENVEGTSKRLGIAERKYIEGNFMLPVTVLFHF